MKRICLFLMMWPAIAHPQPTPHQWYLQSGLPVMPPVSYLQSMTYDPSRGETLCVFRSGMSDFPGTWRWNGSGWTPPTDASTAERADPAGIVFDTVRGVAVLFCRKGSYPNPGHTWEWDGSVWRLAATNGPGTRTDMGMAFDAQRGRTILFGGIDGLSAPLPPFTWEWDGTVWRTMATNGPSRRVNCALAYDAKRRVTVLFGGRADIVVSAQYFGDTWTWNGTDWALVATNGPSPRYTHTMVYDTVRERILLHGGMDGSSNVGLGDLWEWDGTQWIFSSSSEPRRYRAAMAFDAGRGEAVLFGGERDQVEQRETWLLKLHETWVDFAYLGAEIGTFTSPFNTFGEGVTAAPAGSVVKIKTGANSETLTISKRLSVQAFGGPVTIGQ